MPHPSGPLRHTPAGLQAGAPLSFVGGPLDALALVAPELERCEATLARMLHSDVAEVPAVAGHLAAAGGKRLRPALTALGARILGHDQRVDELMCVGELIHLGSLLHDDVVDDGHERRGQPTANVVFGNAVSVLTGDFCLARAVWLAAQAGGYRAVEALGRTVTLMAEGEVLQLKRAGDLGCSRADYIEVIERKSAALISWCAAGAAYALDDQVAIDALERFGYGVGVAFQITDDVLDYQEGTGKAPGVDLRERKVTLPLLLAMERIPTLRARLEAGPPSAAQVVDLMQEIRDAGALDHALAEAHRLAEHALAALDVLPDSPEREALRVMGRYLADRSI